MTSPRLKSVFFGTPHFALSSLQAAFDHTNLIAVVTQPDKPRGRGQQLSPCEVKDEALKKNLPVFSPVSLRKDSPELQILKELLAREKPDLFVVTAYGNILPESFLAIPKLGSINVHASLLPKWRGAAPIQRSIEAGDSETGVCLQKMVMELDAGDVLAEMKMPLDIQVNSGELFSLLAAEGGKLLAHYLQNFDAQIGLRGQAQNPTEITFAKKITKEEGLWSPEWTATEAHNRVRAFNPWPTVRAGIEGGPEFKILRTRLQKDLKSEAGFISFQNSVVTLGCDSLRTGEPGALVLETIQVPGKGPVAAADYFRNYFSKLPSGAGQSRVRAVKIQQ